MKPYSERYRRAVVAKVLGPPRRSAASVARAEGIAASTVNQWLKDGHVGKEKHPTHQSRRKEWTAEEKLAAMVEYEGLSEADRGAYLRQKGLYEATLNQWRDAALGGLSGKKSTPSSTEDKIDRRHVQALEREVAEKEKALAEMAILLALKKKVQAIWGAEENDIASKNGRRS